MYKSQYTEKKKCINNPLDPRQEYENQIHFTLFMSSVYIIVHKIRAEYGSLWLEK